MCPVVHAHPVVRRRGHLAALDLPLRKASVSLLIAGSLHGDDVTGELIKMASTGSATSVFGENSSDFLCVTCPS
jgi:hypothetical protein